MSGRYGCVECGIAFADLDDLAEHDHATHGEPVRYVVDADDDFDVYRPEFIGPGGFSYTMVEAPVLNGVATLPDGRTFATTSKTVRVPILIERDPEEPDAEELDPGSPWNIAGVDR